MHDRVSHYCAGERKQQTGTLDHDNRPDLLLRNIL